MTDAGEPDKPQLQPAPPPPPRYDPDAPYPPEPGPGVLPPIPPPFFPPLPKQPVEPDDTSAPVLPASAPTPPAPPPALPTLPDSAPTPPSAPPLYPDPSAAVGPPAMPPRHKHTDNVRTASEPAYGGLPTASEANRQRAEELREAARKKRKRNRMIGRYVALAIFVVIAAALAGAVYLFQSEDDGDDEVPATTVAGELTGAVGPLSEQVLTMEAAGEIAGGGLIPSAGAIGAIDQAQAAVDQLNGAGAAGTLPGGAASITFAEVTRQQVMPDMLAAISQLLPDAGDGLTRYLVDYPSWQQLDPQAAANWVVLLQALPQSPITVAMPPPGPGQVAVALASSGDVLTNLVAVGLTPAVSVQQPG